MLSIPESTMIGDEVLSVEVSPETAKVIADVMNELHEQIEARCAARGVNINAILVPTYRRVVEAEELEMVVGGRRAMRDESNAA